MKNQPLVIEFVYHAPVARVWRAITDRGEMKKWYFDLAEFKPEVGFEFRFMAGDSEDNQYLHICKITEVIAGKKITYSWRYEGYEGISYVTFDLEPENDKTKLRLTHAGLETFPISNPDLKEERFAEGWNHIVRTSLKEYLEKSGSHK